MLKHFGFDAKVYIFLFCSSIYKSLCVKVCVSCQSRLTPCNPMDCSLPGSSVHGIVQARILEWVAIPFSRDLPNPRIEPKSPVLWAGSQIPYPLSHQENHYSYSYFC